MQAEITIPSYLVPPHLSKYFRQHLCGGCYVCHLVAIGRELRRVLREDGVFWLNLGDSYVGQNNTDNGGNANFGSKAGVSLASKVKGDWHGLPRGCGRCHELTLARKPSPKSEFPLVSKHHHSSRC